MDCLKFRALAEAALDARLDGAPDPRGEEEGAACARHARSCPPCRAAEASLRGLFADLAGPEPPAPPADLAFHLAPPPPLPAGERPVPRAWQWVAAALLAASLGLALAAAPPRPEAPTSPYAFQVRTLGSLTGWIAGTGEGPEAAAARQGVLEAAGGVAVAADLALLVLLAGRGRRRARSGSFAGPEAAG